MKPVAILPARGGSKRLPRKNMIDVLGFPMLSYPLRACIESGVFEEVIVSTEDPEIKEISLKFGARVIDRPSEMATDLAHESLAYNHVLSELGREGKHPEFFCGIYPTALMLEAKDLQKSFEIIQENDADVLMAVSEYPIHPYKSLQKNDDGYYEMVYPVECKQRSQTYPQYVASNGTFYWFRTQQYLTEANYYPKKLETYLLEFDRAPDIDTLEDLHRATALLKYRQKKQ